MKRGKSNVHASAHFKWWINKTGNNNSETIDNWQLDINSFELALWMAFICFKATIFIYLFFIQLYGLNFVSLSFYWTKKQRVNMVSWQYCRYIMAYRGFRLHCWRCHTNSLGGFSIAFYCVGCYFEAVYFPHIYEELSF